ncbi:MAG TPA: hypothetical protein VFN35_17520, partial [Ktedonobacteraceae bacterium]|nr:hypothetical protein [Ktedonobacteraceae bacterium]
GIDDEVRESIAGDAWSRFAKQMTPSKLARFQDHAAILQYLKLCARSATMDAMRIRTRIQAHEESLTEALAAQFIHEDNPLETTLREQARFLVLDALQNDEERLLADLLFFQQLSVAEVLKRDDATFTNAKQIYKCVRNMRARLRHNIQLCQLLSLDRQEVAA